MTRSVGQHHGDLRRALLDAALELVAQRSVEAISRREIARRAGVSPGACYHHFEDRDALLAEIAREGFEALAKLQAAQTAPSPGQRLAKLGEAYVRFALAHETHYRIMFRVAPGEVTGPGAQILQETARATFETLTRAVAAARGGADLGDAPPDDAARGHALLAWSTAHGGAEVARWARGLDPDFDPDTFARGVGQAILAACIAPLPCPEVAS